MAEGPRPFALGAGFVAVALIWGFNYLFVREGLTLAAPLWLAALRAGIGTLGVAAFLLLRPAPRALDRPGRVAATLLGLPNTALFFGLWFAAARDVLPGETAVIVYTFPLWVAILAGPLLGDRPGPVRWAAIGVGFAGVVLISQPWAGGNGALQLLPVVELLLGAMSWAVGTVLMQRRFRPAELLEANAYQLIGGTVGLVVAAAVLEPSSLPAASPLLTADVLWLGLMGTAVAYTIWFYLLGRIPATSLSAFTFLVPVVALGASSVVYGERLDAVQVAGVLLVLGGIYASGRGLRLRAPGIPKAEAGPVTPSTPRRD
jgi:drug/metabolite transporter (DMT)-like permease